ncbi:MAG: glycosyltransferase family 39 protein [Planctomycetaceae bacterium]|jgi:hypothetical protein|nr:glycosyltransferase family 39 protein [Planctomycetaceae bacterium]
MKEKIQTINFPNDFSPKTAAIWFWSLVGFSAVLWILLPTLFHAGYRPDVIELQMVGKEWALATRKHPMLPAWILEIINILTNRAFAAPFIASQICVVISLWSVWQLGRKVLSEKFALLAVIAALPYWFFTIESIKFNQNIALIAFWSLSMYLVFQAFQTNKLFYWAFSGLSLGLAFHAKYTAIFLVLSILAFMTIQPDMRKYWKEKGFYLTSFIAFFTFLPHLIWLYLDDFSILTYVQNRNVSSYWIYHLIYPLNFLANQFFYLIPVCFVLMPCFHGKCFKFSERNNKEKSAERYLFCCIFLPVFIHIVIAALGRIHLTTDYGAIFWIFIGVWFFLRFRTRETSGIFSRTIKSFVFVEAVLIATFLVQSVFSPYFLGTPRRFHFPMRELGIACDKIWDAHSSTPCPYVTGDWIIAGNAAYAMKNRPSVHFYYWQKTESNNMKPTGSWSTDEDVNQKGGMIVWNISDNSQSENDVPDWLRKSFPNAEVIPDPIILPYKTGTKVPPLKVGAAVIPPP